MVSDIGNVTNTKTGLVMKKSPNADGYYKLDLYSNGKRSTKQIHILEAETFLEKQDGKKCVDHIDNNRLNNNIANLRFATNTENNQNASIRKDNTSGHKGISFDKKKNKWHAYIQIDGNKKHLGYFDKIEEAINARKLKANEIQGLFVNYCEKL